VPQHQDRLDQPRETGRAVQVPDGGLGGPERAEARAVRVPPERLAERGEFDRITLVGAGAVRLQIADRLGPDTRAVQRAEHGVALARDTRSGETRLVRTVVGDRGAQDDGVHGVAVGEGVRERLEEYGGHPVAADRAVRGGVEGPYRTGLGDRRALHMAVPGDLRQMQGGRSHHHEVRVAREQRLTGQVDRDEPAGTGGRDVHRRTVEARAGTRPDWR
jgi:hypothetical protein